MFIKRLTGLTIVAASLSACVGTTDTTRDFGVDAGDLSAMKAGIWIDPNGCDHWIIDDGIEGYMSQRLDKYGRPVCSGVGEPGVPPIPPAIANALFHATGVRKRDMPMGVDV